VHDRVPPAGGVRRRVWYNRGVKVKVRLFASYREAVGQPLVEIPIDPDADGPGLWASLVARYPALASLPAPSGYAVNDEYVRDPRPFRESDEVALIPPVSGGDGRRTHPETSDADERAAVTPARPDRAPLVILTDGPISADRVLAEVADPTAGGVVLFLGVVRDNARGRRVQYLTYEAYDVVARRELERIAATAGARWPVTRVAIAHRTGRLGVGETSVAVAVSAPHRAAAFEAARYCIDTLKLTVPIWKKEVWDGGAEWIGSERT
jgi:MoaE-MoaD fusion protein